MLSIALPLNPQVGARVVLAEVKIRASLQDPGAHIPLFTDSGYCLDAPDLIPAGSALCKLHPDPVARYGEQRWADREPEVAATRRAALNTRSGN